MAFCTHCGAQLPENAASCAKCGFAVPPRQSCCDFESELRYVIPVGRSWWSILAGYLGLLSPIPPVGVFAVLFGVVAIRGIRRHPGQLGLGRAWFAIVMGALFTVVHLVALVVACF